MCLYCPTCGVRVACMAHIKSLHAREVMDYLWADVLEQYCYDNTKDDIECSVCHAR